MAGPPFLMRPPRALCLRVSETGRTTSLCDWKRVQPTARLCRLGLHLQVGSRSYTLLRSLAGDKTQLQGHHDFATGFLAEDPNRWGVWHFRQSFNGP